MIFYTCSSSSAPSSDKNIFGEWSGVKGSKRSSDGDADLDSSAYENNINKLFYLSLIFIIKTTTTTTQKHKCEGICN